MEPQEDPTKAVLRPRNPGENLKVAKVILRRRDRNLKAAAERAQKIQQLKRKQRDFVKGADLKIIRPETLVRNCRVRLKDKKRLIKQANTRKPKPGKGKFLIAVRNSRLGGSHEVKAMLRTLHLKRRHRAVFLPNNEETMARLHLCKPFLYWGHPSFKTLLNIVHKKALFRDPEAEDGCTLLSDNVLIEKHLGDLGLLCTEDLAHAIYTCSKQFAAVTDRLWAVPIGDTTRANGMIKARKHTWGNQTENIDAIIAKLLGE